MKDSLAPGIQKELTITITPEMGVSHLGAGPGVLSTPSMIGLMERVSYQSVEPHLDTNEQTVGTMVHVWHRAGVKIGLEVTVRARVVERDRRRLLFEVEMDQGDLRIGDGTHERFVINLDKYK